MTLVANIKIPSRLCWFWLVVLTVALLAGGVLAQDTTFSEQEVKAAFLVNFPKYVDWPAESFSGTNSPFVIAVLGETKVAGELQKMAASRTVDGRKIILKRLIAGETPSACHILFIPASEQSRASDVLAKIKGESILTVGESDTFLDGGGMVNMERQNRKIALTINPAAVQRARLKISSKLLGVAEVVKDKSK